MASYSLFINTRSIEQFYKYSIDLTILMLCGMLSFYAFLVLFFGYLVIRFDVEIQSFVYCQTSSHFSPSFLHSAFYCGPIAFVVSAAL